MPAITIDTIQPLIANEKVDHRTIHFAFGCPVSGKTFPATAQVNSTNAKSQMIGRAKRTAFHSIRGPLSSAIRKAFGYNNVFGRLIGDVASAATYSAATATTQGSNFHITKEQRNDAAVTAFTTIASQFTWDEGRNSWVAAETLKEITSRFELQLKQHPLSANYDREIAARMLVEVAKADGTIGREERVQLGQFLDPALGTVEELAARPPLNDAELGETSGDGPRQTMLMLAWALALADDEFATEEESRLQAFSQGLGLDANCAAQARHDAEGYIIEQAIARNHAIGRDGEPERAEIVALGERLGITRATVEAIDARYRKRQLTA